LAANKTVNAARILATTTTLLTTKILVRTTILAVATILTTIMIQIKMTTLTLTMTTTTRPTSLLSNRQPKPQPRRPANRRSPSANPSVNPTPSAILRNPRSPSLPTPPKPPTPIHPSAKTVTRRTTPMTQAILEKKCQTHQHYRTVPRHLQYLESREARYPHPTPTLPEHLCRRPFDNYKIHRDGKSQRLLTTNLGIRRDGHQQESRGAMTIYGLPQRAMRTARQPSMSTPVTLTVMKRVLLQPRYRKLGAATLERRDS
jgi:hypothetical protein